MKPRIPIGAAALVQATLAAGGLLPVTAAYTAESGELLYQAHCASCHGENLEGEPDWRSPKEDGTLPAPPHDATGHTWHHGDRLLFDYTKLGGEVALRMRGVMSVKSAMPGFGETLTDDQIRSILDFIKTRWGARERDYQAKITAQE